MLKTLTTFAAGVLGGILLAESLCPAGAQAGREEPTEPVAPVVAPIEDFAGFETEKPTESADWESIEVQVYHYCPCKKCCGKEPTHPAYKLTRSGEVATEGRTVAVDPEVIPLGSEVIIEGHRYIAEDTGVKGNKVDIFVEDHTKAIMLGTYTSKILWRGN